MRPAFVALLALAACGSEKPGSQATADRARALLEGAPGRIRFHLLDPNPQVPEARAGKPVLHGWTVLERKAVDDAALAGRIRATLADPTAYGDQAVPCFRPGLAFAFEGDRPVDFVICLECSRIECFRDGREIDTLLLSPAGNERLLGIYTQLAGP